MEHSFFDDAFLAITADQTELGTFSHPGPGHTNSEIPVPEDLGEILPDALTPAQSSSSPTCTTPTTPSSSCFSGAFAGSILSATPITPTTDYINGGTPSPAEDLPMEDFVPISYPLDTVLPLCWSPPPPVASLTAPAAAAESSSQVPTPSIIVPMPGSSSVLTPTSSRSSPQPTASPPPKDHVEVGDTPSASERRKDRKHYRCRCGKRYNRRCELTKHIKRYNRVHPCPVEECEYHTIKWSTLKDLQRHLESKHAKPERHIRCVICNTMKPRKDNMRDHIRRRHFETRPELVAPKMAEIMDAHAERIRQLDAANG